MKKRLVSLLLCLALLLCMLPAWSAPVHAATASQNNIVDRANYLYNATWVCQRNVYGWNNYTFYAGNTYRIPYGQPVYAGAYVGFGVSVDGYLAAAADANSVFYTSRSNYAGNYSTYYATDCSAFVSWCWGINRQTTATIPNFATYKGMANSSNVYNLQLGDALNSNSVGHVVLVTGLTYSNGVISQIEITEQTPPQLKRSYYSPSSLASKYGSYYGIYRFNGTAPAAPTTTGPGPVDGVYTIGSAINSAFKLDISGPSLDSGTNVHLWEQHYGDSQRFVIQKYGDYYTLRNYYTGAYLDAGGTDGNVYQWQNSGTPNDYQLWKIWSNSDGTYSMSPKSDSAKRLDLDGGSTTNGTNIKLWTSNGSNAQKWVLNAQNLLTDGIYKFASAVDANYVLDISGGSTDNGGNLQLWDRATSGSCYFVLQTSADGYCYLRAQHSNKYLDVYNGLTDSGTNVQQYDGNGTLAQKWSAIPNSDGTWSFVSCGSGKYMDVNGGTAADGSNIQIWDGNGSAAQKWVPEVCRSIQDGVYRLCAHDDSNQVVEVVNSETEAGSNIQIWTNGGFDNSKVIIEYAVNGAYTLRMLHSQLCIDLAGGSSVPGTNVEQHAPNGTAAQLWRIVPNNDGSYNIVSMVNGLHLDCQGASTANGTNVHGYTPNRTSAQKFWITPTTVGLDGVWNIAPSGDTGYVLDIDGESTEANGNLEINAASGSDSQKFIVQSIGDQYYAIRNLNSGLLLNVEGAGTANGTNVQQYNAQNEPLSNEKWQIIPNADGTYSFVSTSCGLYLDLYKNELTDGTNVQVWSRGGNPAQKWVFTERYAVVEDGVYQLKSFKDSTFVVDIDAPDEETAQADKANAQIWTAADSDNQKFHLKHEGNGYYSIISLYSGKALDVESASKLPGANVQQYTCNGSAAQLWTVLPNTDGSVTFVSKSGGNTLDIAGGTMANGTNLRVWYGNTTEAQRWILESTTHTHLGTVQEVKAPTCTEQGYTVYLCTRCGETYHDTFTDALGHSYSATETMKATCTQQGYTIYSCANCGDSYHDDYTAMLGHSYSTLPAVEPTCTEPGKTQGEKCTNCGDVSIPQETIPALGHDYVVRNTGASHTLTCERCGSSSVEDHSYVDGSCFCGAKEAATDAALNFYATSIGLEDKIIYSALVSQSVVTNYDSYYVEFVNLDSTDERMSIYKQDAGTAFGSKYTLFQFPIYVCQMTDRIEATLYGVKDGVTYRGQSVVHSVEEFVLTLMPSLNEKMQKMAANLLEYGAMMQLNFGHRTDHLANDELGSYAELVLHTVPSAADNSTSTSNGYTGASLYRRVLGISSTVELQYAFNMDSSLTMTDLRAEITVGGKTTVIDGADFTPLGKRFVVIFSDLLPTQGDVDIEITIYSKTTGQPISETYTDRLSYAVAVYQASGNETITNAVNAMLNYYRLAEEAYR